MLQTPRSFLLAVALLPPLAAPSFAGDPGTNYCTSLPNSTGGAALMSAEGSSGVEANDIVLHAGPVPAGQFGIFFYGSVAVEVPFGNGVRCVETGNGEPFRLYPAVPTAPGVMTYELDLEDPPVPAAQIHPGSTWYFQAWFRDPAGGGATFNTSDGYRITFLLPDAYHGMVLIDAGSFEMGRHEGSGDADELPLHAVSVDAFYMDRFEVTHRDFARNMNNALERGEVEVVAGVLQRVGGAGEVLCDTSASSPWSHLEWNGTILKALRGWAERPLVQVTWYGACAYANGKSRDEGLTPCYDEMDWSRDFAADGFRLPTEAEWEYAARGGEQAPYFMYPWGDAIDGSMANYEGSGDAHEDDAPATTPVGYYDGDQTPVGGDMANGFGLHDMSGNVWEWCGDWYDGAYYADSPSDNPSGPDAGTARVIRGGSWSSPTSSLRTAERLHAGNPGNRGNRFGFRVVARRP
ncbi:MAG: hypothetical protein CMJ84_15710 [Planctomycetes bacterium]|jgi:formylglycine-generating enzyme required for sulfatase activity|nr:hypothetical protein [Planctomycetota bacterium]MDP6410478.1 SUMF1/EgtB/PvdO family nonheme iron enzyme [Planctomycetota bacterium]